MKNIFIVSLAAAIIFLIYPVNSFFMGKGKVHIFHIYFSKLHFIFSKYIYIYIYIFMQISLEARKKKI